MYFTLKRRIAQYAHSAGWVRGIDDVRQALMEEQRELVRVAAPLDRIVEEATAVQQDLLRMRREVCEGPMLARHRLADHWNEGRRERYATLLERLDYGTAADPQQEGYPMGRGSPGYTGTSRLRLAAEDGHTISFGDTVCVLPHRKLHGPFAIGYSLVMIGAARVLYPTADTLQGHSVLVSHHWQWPIALGVGMVSYAFALANEFVKDPYTRIGDELVRRAADLSQQMTLIDNATQ